MRQLTSQAILTFVLSSDNVDVGIVDVDVDK